MTSQKGFAPILIIIIITVSIGLGVFLVDKKTHFISQAIFGSSHPSASDPKSEIDFPSNTIPNSNNQLILGQVEYPKDPPYIQKATISAYDLDKKEYADILQSDNLAELGINLKNNVGFYYNTIDITAKTIPNSVTVISSTGTKKTIELEKSDLWTLSSYNRTVTSDLADHSCFISPDGEKMACGLTERVSPLGAGTGRDKIVVYDFETEKLTEAFISDSLYKPNGSAVTFSLKGWRGNDEILFIHLNQGPTISAAPTDFYTLNVSTKKVAKQLSYVYSMLSPLLITPDGNELIFASIDVNYQRPVDKRVIEQIVRFNFETKKIILIPANSEGFTSARYSLSSDNQKFLYYTPLDKLLHTYDLKTEKETTLLMTESVAAVEALLPDNKTYIFSNPNSGNSVTTSLFDSQTKKITLLKGFYIASEFAPVPVELMPKSEGTPIPVLKTFLPTLKPMSKVVATPKPVESTKKTVTVTLNGKVFNDKNCNDVLESGEEGLPNVEVRIEYKPLYQTITTVISNANGDYSYSKTIDENETISIGPSLVAPDGFKIHNRDEYSNVNKQYPIVTLNFPLAPISAINDGLCSIPNF